MRAAGGRWLVLAALALGGRGAQAEVRSLTVGIDTTCPYGLEACWPDIADALRQLDDVSSVGSRADGKALTGTLTPRGGCVPDLDRLARTIHATSAEFTLRGVEAAVAGSLTREAGGVWLRVSGTGERILLAPLSQRLEWDPVRKRRRAALAAEKTAYARIERQPLVPEGTLLVSGPVSRGPDGTLCLQVRRFEVERASRSRGKVGR